MSELSEILRKSDDMTKARKGILMPIAYIYAFAPLLIFVFFWLRWVIAIPLGIVSIATIYRSYQKDSKINLQDNARKQIPAICLAIGIILLWVLFSGIGASVVQYPDHILRNTLFDLLLTNEWPVTMDVGEISPRGISYYIGFWLPAAYIAKFTSYRIGLIALQIWSILGLMLIWFLVCEKQKKTSVWFLVVFMFFGGADFIGRLLTGSIETQVGNRYEWWAEIFNYPGVSTGLFWVFNQVIYAWLIYCLLDRQKENKTLILIWSNLLITSTFAAIGIIPFVVYWAYRNTVEQGENRKIFSRAQRTIRDCVSVENAVGILLSFVTSTFLISNGAITTVASETTKESITSSANDIAAAGFGGFDSGISAYAWTTKLWIYLLFILLEVGLYYILIYKHEKKNPIFWISFVVLLICPWIKVGWNIDFCMRASIPALFCLYQMVIRSLSDYAKSKERLLAAMLVVLIVISSVTTFDSMYGVAKETVKTLEEEKKVGLYIRKKDNFMKDYNFTSSCDSFFYKYLAGRR